MKVLILSCSTGQGHNSAARAVYETMTANGIECEFKDAFSIVGERAPKRASNIYSAVAGKAPLVFGAAYHIASFISNPKIKSPVYAANMLWADKVAQYIEDNNFDTVVTSHLFVAQVLTRIKRKNKLNIFTMAIITDYTSSPFWEETELDYYVIPHEELINEFVKKGVPEDKLLPFGIPVSNQYKRVYSKAEAREILNLPQNIHTVLIMTGSMGYGNIKPVIKEILLKFENKVKIIVMAGNNKELKNKLDEIYGTEQSVDILEFTPHAGLYMDAVDVMLTKPGGLSTTESAVKNIPLILTDQIPGCESRNVRFFKKHGMAYYSSKPKNQAKYAKLLKDKPNLAEKMMKAQRETINADASADIYGFICSNINNK